MISVSEQRFQELMEDAMASIPGNFKQKMENIAFIIEPYPSAHDLEKVGLKEGSMLLGLYSGIPYTHRSSWYNAATPDRILLFQKNIEYVCSTESQLVNKIKEVIIHEVGHYFGLNEEQIRAAGY